MKVYSKYWRKNRSTHEAAELALSLRALRKVAACFGSNAKPVFWKGMVDANDDNILMDMGNVKGGYPIPHYRFDMLVAKVVQAETAVLESSDLVVDKVLSEAPEAPDFAKPYLEKFINAAEDIYIYELNRSKIWSYYLTQAWQAELLYEKKNMTLPLTADGLANMWRDEAILGEVNEALRHFYGSLMEVLRDYADAVRALIADSSPEERSGQRINLYLKMWTDIYEIISSWKEHLLNPGVITVFDKVDSEIEVSGGETGEDDGDEANRLTEKQESDGLDPDLADEVSDLLEDITADQAQTLAVKNPSVRSLGTVVLRSEIKSEVKPDELIVRRLRRIFKRQKAQIRRSKKVMRRALPAGKLDARRLYRVPLDEKVFKNRQVPRTDHMWQICIVTDASASMAGRGQDQTPWEVAEKTFVSLATAAKGFKNHLDIYAYNEEKRICKLTKLYHGSEIYSILPAGRTPSGQAILTAAIMLNQKYKKSMVIHITDGAANCGLPLGEAVNYCLNNHIEVFTIGCGCTRQTKKFLRESFPPGRLYFMQDINYLADGLEQLFKRKILEYA
ncbi:MAG: hypothetical protein JRI85_02310 [Deltaproteobacteria bacterium]|nr:hypothetical protein [Deltaproteobacteria bacterium]